MIKFVTKLLKGNNPWETKVTLTPVIQPSKKDMFDTAVKHVIYDNAFNDVSNALSELCYNDDVIKDTRAALSYLEDNSISPVFDEMNRKERKYIITNYPLVNFTKKTNFLGSEVGVPFKEQLLIKRLTDTALANIKD